MTAATGAKEANDQLVDRLTALDLSDEIVARPSLLPDWTVGHLLTHIARNADSHRRLVEAALAGTVTDQYVGGMAQRWDEILAGAGRPIDVQLADLAESGAALADAYARADRTPGTWDLASRRWGDQPWPVGDLPFVRWREVALHTIDLGFPELTAASWRDDYVEHELHRNVSALPARLRHRQLVSIDPTDLPWSTVVVGAAEADPAGPATVQAPARELVEWLTGRSAGREGWPEIGEWAGVP